MNNSKFKISSLKSQDSSRDRTAFTLVELIIVVSILGILAAIVIPEFSGHIQQAKEAAAKDNLRLLRQAIERYEGTYGVPPGYPDNDPSNTPSAIPLITQIFSGDDSLSGVPQNPFNGLQGIAVVPDFLAITENLIENTTAGWVYHPATKTVKLCYSGTDSQGNNYFDY